MKEFLKKLGLIEYLITELHMSSIDFTSKLHEIVDEGGTGYFSDMFDIFSSGKNELKKRVEYQRFKIKRRKRFFDSSMNSAVASGTFNEHCGTLTVENVVRRHRKQYL